MSRRVTARATGFLAFSLGMASAYAGPVVPEGVHLSFSPRGQTYFREHLNDVLLANKLDLSHQHWDEIKFVVNDPFRPDSMSDGVRALHDRFASFFYGFPIKTPRVEVKLAGANLDVKFRAMGAVVDPAGPAAYGAGRSNGVVILMRLEGEALRFGVESLRLNDLANPGLFGSLGFDKIASSYTDGAHRTIKAELPVLVEADGKKATMRVLAVRTNLLKTGFETAFDKLLAPKIKVSIDDRELAFDLPAFEAELRGQLPKLNLALAEAVKNYFEKEGKDLIQPSFDELASSLNIQFKIPLSDETANDLTVDLRPKKTEYSRSSRILGLAFDAEISDAKLDGGRGLFPVEGSSGRAKLAGAAADGYDIALAVHPAGINGILDRAWAKGILRDIAMGNDDSGHPTTVKIPRPPLVSFEGQPRPDQANFHAWIGYVVRGMAGILFKGPIPIELDLRVRVETNAKNELEVVFEEINEATLKVDTRATWLAPIRKKVDAMVRSQITKLNKDLVAKRTLLTTIPTLNELIGIPLKLDGAQTEAGNLVLLAEFAPKP